MMKACLMLLLWLTATTAFAQAPSASTQPTDVVQHFWASATEGELLSSEGWTRASRAYANPANWPGSNIIRVVSNHWEVDTRQVVTKEGVATVFVWSREAGRIDSSLRFTPTIDDSIRVEFCLAFGQSYGNNFDRDGKVVSKFPLGEAWRITDPLPALPWTTVNTALRYVLEQRVKASDPKVKENADKTIAALLKRN